MRNLLVTVSGVVLSFILLSAGVFLTMRSTVEGKMSRELAPQVSTTSSGTLAHEAEEFGDPLKLLAHTLWIYELAVLPCIAVLIGLFVGVFTKAKAPAVSAVSLLPLVVFYMLSASWSARSVADSVVYVCLGIAASVLVVRRRIGLPDAHGTAH